MSQQDQNPEGQAWMRLVGRLNQAVQTQARESNQFLLSDQHRPFRLIISGRGFAIEVDATNDYETAQRTVALLERLLSGEVSPRSTVGHDQPLSLDGNAS